MSRPIDEEKFRELAKLMFKLVPADGSAIGNVSLRNAFIETGKEKGYRVSENMFDTVRKHLLKKGKLVRGRGKGGSVKRTNDKSGDNPKVAETSGDFALLPTGDPQRELSLQKKAAKPGTRTPRRKSDDEAQVLSYRHTDKRKNNPEVGMVKPENDPDEPHSVWKYDPHIDPALQFDISRSQIENFIDDALGTGDAETMRNRKYGTYHGFLRCRFCSS